MIRSEESDDGRFSGGEEDGSLSKRKKRRSPRKKKTQKIRPKGKTKNQGESYYYKHIEAQQDHGVASLQ